MTMGLNKTGKAGCGCLLFVVIVCMVLAAMLVHPFSLKILTGRLVYQDKIVPSEALFVPRFPEDKTGELYQEAFREFWAGNGKVIYVEDDQVLGVSVKEIVAKMAKQRGIKEDVVKKVEIGAEGEAQPAKVKERFAQLGVKKVILVVPEYASRRYHLLYGSDETHDNVLFFVKPVTMSYFKREKWWATEPARTAVQRELYTLGTFYFNRFKYGAKEDSQKR
jgi:hypothetical protein